MSLDYFYCQLLLKWRDGLHYHGPVFSAWLRTSEAFSVWLSDLLLHRSGGGEPHRASVPCLSCQKTLDSKGETQSKALAHSDSAGRIITVWKQRQGISCHFRGGSEKLKMGGALYQPPTVMPALQPIRPPALLDALSPAPTFQPWWSPSLKIQGFI